MVHTDEIDRITEERSPREHPIADALNGLNARMRVNCSMPGHRGRISIDSCNDITELPGMDNLSQPEGVIAMSQEKAAAVYGVPYVKYLVNGSTCGNLAMINGLLKENDGILMERNSHRSVYSALTLKRLVCHFMYNDDFRRPVTLDTIKNHVELHPDVSAVFLTSPTYMGYRADLKNIYAYLKEKGILLLVDGAHGAHLRMFRESAEDYIHCDAMVISVHKTMGGLNQSAMLLSSDRQIAERLKKAINIFQTTSPSYLIMKSMEDSIYDIEDLRNRVPDFRQTLKELIEDRGMLRSIEIDGEDPYKAILTLPGNGEHIFNALVERGIYPELFTEEEVLLMLSHYNSTEDLEYIAEQLLDIDAGITAGENGKDTDTDTELDIHKTEKRNLDGALSFIENERVLDIFTAMEKEGMMTPLEEAEGRICGDFLIPYPPGVPLVVPGEVISRSIIERAGRLLEGGTEIVGIHEGKVTVIDED